MKNNMIKLLELNSQKVLHSSYNHKPSFILKGEQQNIDTFVKEMTLTTQNNIIYFNCEKEEKIHGEKYEQILSLLSQTQKSNMIIYIQNLPEKRDMQSNYLPPILQELDFGTSSFLFSVTNNAIRDIDVRIPTINNIYIT